MRKKLYAFFIHDKPPYMLGGNVINIRDNGNVSIDGYDVYRDENGDYKFVDITRNAIVAIVSKDEGLRLQKKLDRAEKRYNSKVQKAKEKYQRELQKAADDLKSVREMIAKKNIHHL